MKLNRNFRFIVFAFILLNIKLYSCDSIYNNFFDRVLTKFNKDTIQLFQNEFKSKTERYFIRYNEEDKQELAIYGYSQSIYMYCNYWLNNNIDSIIAKTLHTAMLKNKEVISCLKMKGISYKKEQHKILLFMFYNKLNNFDLNYSIVDSVSAMLWKIDSLVAFRSVSDTIDDDYIPSNALELINYFSNVIIVESEKSENNEYKDILNNIKQKTESEFKIKEHFGLGSYLRGKYLGRTRITVYFQYIGIRNPEMMSGVILQGIYRKINNIELDIKKLIFENRDKELDEPLYLRY